jgi:competence protein ComEC
VQKSYTYWRAAHPLVFISSLLLLGVVISNGFAKLSFFSNPLFLICLLFLELAALFTCLQIQNKPVIKGILVMSCLISWGVMIQWNASSQTHFELPSYINRYIIYCRNGLIDKINKTILPKEANGFALALLIGVKMDMNKALVNAYTQLGIIHIIAISGMHLDILFKSLKRLTSYFPKNRIFNILEIVILLIIVWTYTLMAYASPSIVRASVFFSIYLIGNFNALPSFALNTIAGGILFLILMNVRGVEHIGLQLSYAAVIGIHLFYKILYTSIEIDNPIIQFLWSNCCVSLAAQLTTFPILLLHFHQVASWVLVSNFIMVPLSNLILYGLAIILILPKGLAIYVGILVAKYIQFFNHFVQHWFLNTKAGTLQITMNTIQVLGFYLILLLVYLWIYQKKSSYLLAVLGLITSYTVLKLFS